MKGIVKWFNIDKGYGFLESQDGDVLVHHSAIVDKKPGLRNLESGEIVEYDLIYTITGLKAKNVRTVI